MERKHLSEYAERLFGEGFRNALYIGRHQIWADGSRRPHKFYYIGYRDAFGVRMPEPKGWSLQIWGLSWVMGRSEKLDEAVKSALKGDFPKVRHNVQLNMRAKSHGKVFIRPIWLYWEKAPAPAKAAEKLPIRGHKKRQRRELLV